MENLEESLMRVLDRVGSHVTQHSTKTIIEDSASIKKVDDNNVEMNLDFNYTHTIGIENERLGVDFLLNNDEFFKDINSFKLIITDNQELKTLNYKIIF